MSDRVAEIFDQAAALPEWRTEVTRLATLAPIEADREMEAAAGRSAAAEDRRPGLLGVGEHIGAELLELALGVLPGRNARGLTRCLDPAAEARVDAEGVSPAAEQLQGHEDEHPDQPQAAADPAACAAWDGQTAAASAPLFDHVRVLDPAPPHGGTA